MRQTLIVSLLGLGACVSSGKPPLDDSFGDFGGKTDVFSSKFGKDPSQLDIITSGQPVDVDYTNPPRYRGLRYLATGGDSLDIKVSAPGQTGEDADPVAWLLNSRFEIVTKNDDTSADDPASHLVAANLDAGTYYVVFRERSLQPAKFEVNLQRTGGGNGVALLTDPAHPPWMKYRAAGGTWLDPEKIGDGSYVMRVTGPYQLVSVCATPTTFSSHLWQRTPGDDNGTLDLSYFSCDTASTDTGTVTVTGTLAQAGSVWMGYYPATLTAPGPFSIDVPRGTWDLAAGDDAHFVMIQRGVSVQAATSVGAIDLSSGIALQKVSVAVTGATPDSTVTSSYSSANGSFSWSGAQLTDPLPVVPASQIASGDSEVVEIDDSATTTNGSTYRFANVTYTGQASVALVLPPSFETVSFPKAKGAALALPALPNDYTRVGFTASANGSSVALHATRSYLDGTNTAQLALDAPPGYDAAWTIDLSAPYRGSFHANSNGADGMWWTTASESVNTAPSMAQIARPERSVASRTQRMLDAR